ncbi:hypothetical protein J1614_012247 [Plenodomus biglobosus]|nr:hypothetical protein J1614_012247 [Plenodomus biglobosus]
MKHLSDRFDRDTGNTSIILFQTLTNLLCHDSDDLQQHLDEFQQHYMRMAKICASSSQSVATAIKPMFDHDEVKGSFFLTALPDTMENTFYNPNSRNVTEHIDIEPKSLDISYKQLLEQTGSSSATYAARQNTGRQSRQDTRATKPRTGA